MKLILPFILMVFSVGCAKKPTRSTQEVRLIDREADILNEEDLEELPEN